MEVTLRGIGVSPGVGIGPAILFRVQSIEPPRYAIDDPGRELGRFDEAVTVVRTRLTDLRNQTAEELGERHAAIFNAHLAILDDVALRPEIERRLQEEKVNVEYLVDDLIAGYTKLLRQTDDPQFRERSTDFVDVGRRILGELLDKELESLEHLDHPGIVMADDLSPSDTANMDLANTWGVATDTGGPTSHTAILARAFEIPAVVGLRYSGAHVSPGEMVIVDGTNGVVVIRPDADTLGEYEVEKARQDEDRRALLELESDGVAKCADGNEIQTHANIELPIETDLSIRMKAQGIGLYRTEYLFMNRTTTPSEEEQYQAYKHVVAAMAPAPVTMRTLDVGGDKIISHLNQKEELNPQLGWRSIRFCLDRPDIFKAQLRALFRASVHGNLNIMFPMISGVDQLHDAMEVVDEVRADLRARGVPFNEDVPVGSMIEVPAAVTIADKLARHCGFFSIGTNDLIQYTLAVDRVNDRTAHLYEPAHPAVLRMLKQVADAAKEAEIPVSICGEMAGDPLFTETLIGLGFTTLSMSSVSIPLVRAEIFNTRLSVARKFARKLLDMESCSAVRAELRKRYDARNSVSRLRHGIPGEGEPVSQSS